MSPLFLEQALASSFTKWNQKIKSIYLCNEINFRAKVHIW